MKISWIGFLGRNHSWSVVARSVSRELVKMGHQVDLCSTNGITCFPDDLRPNLKNYIPDSVKIEKLKPEEYLKLLYNGMDKDYDLSLSYTAPKNFESNLALGKKKLGIWCYEWAGKNVLPHGFNKGCLKADKVLAPSEFAKKIFVDSNVPKDRVKVIPHGISENYLGSSKMQLPTNKKFKILANIAQNHKRKNIKGLLEAYGQAFTREDDVVLLLKSTFKKVEMPFDVSLEMLLKDFKNKYKNHAEIKVLTEFMDDVSALYRSVDVVFTMSFCEGFYFPGLEAIASGKMVISPDWGGQKDFLDENNSLLISGKESRADPTSMYWESKNNAIWFDPNIEDAVVKLKFAMKNYQEINNVVEKNRSIVYDNYNWTKVTEQILKEYHE